MVETVAPGFVTPPRGVQVPPVVSIVGTGRPLSEGIKLHHNRDKYGFFLGKEIEGFGLSPFENTTLPRASGGATLRHRRTAEGTMFLPLTLVSPNPASMYDMMAWLVDTVTGQDGFFDVVYFDPYYQEARRRTVLYDSGLETVNEVIPDFKHVVGITGTFLSPFWRGPERVVVERIAPPVKPLITADPGQPVDRWPDPGFGDASAYAPWFVVDGGLEKNGTGAEHGVFVAGHRISVNPGETVSVSADLSFVDGPQVGAIQVRVRAYDDTATLVPGSEQTVIGESYAGTYTGTYVVPATGAEIELGFYTASDVHANTRVRIDGLDVKRDVTIGTQYKWNPDGTSSKYVDEAEVSRNLIKNPSFESSTDGWGSTGYDVQRVSAHSELWGGQGSGDFVAVTKSRGASALLTVTESENNPVEPGRFVALAALVAAGPTQNVRIGLVFSDGSTVATGYDPAPYPAGDRAVVIAEVPSSASGFRAQIRGYSGSSGVIIPDGEDLYFDSVIAVQADSEAEALAQIETYFDGDFPDVIDEGSREGAFSFPFFPVFLADSTVQGEHELRVEGDAPVWPIWEIQGPGRDVEIIGPCGSRLFVEGEVTTPITIVTEPGKRSIRDASGLIWDRMKPGDDQFFALEPGLQTVKMTMVGGNPESTIRAVYSENWKTPRGTAQGMIRGGVV